MYLSASVSAGNAPKLVDGLSDLTIVSPESVSLECKINLGDPKAEVHWYRDKKELAASKKYEMSQDGEDVALVIKTTEPSDSGNYSCEAVNKLGKVKTQGTLVVNSKSFVYLQMALTFVLMICFFKITV